MNVLVMVVGVLWCSRYVCVMSVSCCVNMWFDVLSVLVGVVSIVCNLLSVVWMCGLFVLRLVSLLNSVVVVLGLCDMVCSMLRYIMLFEFF